VDPDSRLLKVAVSDGRGRGVRDGGLARWLERVAPPSARGEVAIALVSDARMRTLNRSYRSKDYVTDVLSFSTTPRSGNGMRTADGGRPLGDLVIARGVATRQAREAGHSYQTELRVLALHGLLHLLGFDHEDPEDRGRMQRIERRLRRKGGLPAGLIERAPASRAARRSAVPRRGTPARARVGLGRRGH
jgi:probable rRNA maturation factor